MAAIFYKNSNIVYKSLKNYAETVQGGLEEANIDFNHHNCMVISEQKENTCVLYPYKFTEIYETSTFISRNLNALVMSIHIHDDILWMFELIFEGEIVAKFNTIPDYWNEMSEDEINQWNCSAELISKYITNAQAKDIENYLIQWENLDPKASKAYPDDEYNYGNCWQVLDFLKKLGINYPLDERDLPVGKTYKLSTLFFPIDETSKNFKQLKKANKWWRFWVK